jgi:hypothetical protein
MAAKLARLTHKIAKQLCGPTVGLDLMAKRKIPVPASNRTSVG